MTINCAYELKQEDKLGSIEKNKVANFTVMDGNLLTCDEDALLNINVIKTIVDGEIVYSK